MRVLIVDDELPIAETLCELLQAEGYETVSAGNGKEALAAFDTTSPDLVVSDVMMPLLDGRELVREIRASPRGHRLPIILISAARGVAHEADLGHDLFLEKPFDLEVFQLHVRRLLTSRDEVS